LQANPGWPRRFVTVLRVRRLHPDSGVTVIVCRPEGAMPTEAGVFATHKSRISGFELSKREFLAGTLPRKTPDKLRKTSSDGTNPGIALL
jgi:hypothetical protein